jgi:peroxiredoxin Q/BCP
MLKIGDRLPPFSGTRPDGSAWSSEALQGSPAVVFFYPRDFTSICTREVCGFRDLYGELRRRTGAEIVGVSRDSAARHARFAAEHRLPFLLLSEDGSASRAFGVERLRGWLPFPRRATFVADRDGWVRGVFRHETDVGFHLRGVRETTSAWRAADAGPANAGEPDAVR